MADERGLYIKYRVDRIDCQDAPGGKHEGCNLFVLDLNHDPHGRTAALAYAEACRADRPNLAADLEVAVNALGGGEHSLLAELRVLAAEVDIPSDDDLEVGERIRPRSAGLLREIVAKLEEV